MYFYQKNYLNSKKKNDNFTADNYVLLNTIYLNLNIYYTNRRWGIFFLCDAIFFLSLQGGGGREKVPTN